jgi:hypothetical protein
MYLPKVPSHAQAKLEMQTTASLKLCTHIMYSMQLLKKIRFQFVFIGLQSLSITIFKTGQEIIYQSIAQLDRQIAEMQ